MSEYKFDVSLGPVFDNDIAFNKHVPEKRRQLLLKYEHQLRDELYKAANNYNRKVAKLRDAQKAQACSSAIDGRGFAVILHHVAQLYCQLLANNCSPGFSAAHFAETMEVTAARRKTDHFAGHIEAMVKQVAQAAMNEAVHEAASKNPNN